MRSVSFSYRMHIVFSEDVRDHRFKLRCLPSEGPQQRITELEYRIEPASFFREAVDEFGNRYVYGCKHGPHHNFFADIRGRAILNSDAKADADPPHRLGLYRAMTPLTTAGEAIKGALAGIDLKKEKSFQAFVEKLQIALNERMIYQRGITDHTTTAEEAFANGYGVCQDYVHIFLTMLRYYGIACRYVAGLVPGEGETHAWAEVCIDGKWHGFDPTNRCHAEDEYLALSRGRDANDCQINRGIFFGNAAQTVTIATSLIEDEGAVL